MSLGYCELKKHKPWFNEGCLKLLDQRKQLVAFQEGLSSVDLVSYGLS
jgi:hypothetical protein